MYIITGGGTGIGRALALELASRNQSVCIIGRRKRPLKEVASHSSLISYLSADITTKKGLQSILEYTKTIPSIDALIHCAAIILPIASTVDLNPKDWNKLIATNINAPLFLTQILIDKLKNGRLLFLNSKLAEIPVKGLAAYCVSKAGLAMLLQTWQKDDSSIVMTCAKPGVVNTALTRQLLDAQYGDEALQTALRNADQKNLFILPQTVALFLTWLLLDIDKARYQSKLWDIHDRSHHAEWLVAPHTLPDQSNL